jgi:hypothetical protein
MAWNANNPEHLERRNLEVYASIAERFEISRHREDSRRGEYLCSLLNTFHLT